MPGEHAKRSWELSRADLFRAVFSNFLILGTSLCFPRLSHSPDGEDAGCTYAGMVGWLAEGGDSTMEEEIGESIFHFFDISADLIDSMK